MKAQQSSKPRMTLPMLAVVAGGTLLTLFAATAWSMPGSDVAELAILAGGTAGLGAAAATALMRILRQRSFAAQVVAAALATLVPALLGVWAASRAMIVDGHAVGALTVVLLATGTVAIVTALMFGRRVAFASATLIDAARRMGDGARGLSAVSPPAPVELTRLHHELATTAARLEEARQRERALDRSRRELVAWVSHDLRTPLAGIKALAEALEDGVADDDATVQRYHRALGVEVDRVSELVDDLFELSRAQAGVLRLELAPVSLGDLVSDAIASATPVANAKGVRVIGTMCEEPREMHASSSEVLRALRNVLENAIRHTPPDGTITVEVGIDRERACVSVLDEGGGIAEADLPRVFDVAFRGDAARTPGSGAGLGLAIARELIEAHQGDISVRNQNGGACFTVRLPLRPVVAH